MATAAQRVTAALSLVQVYKMHGKSLLVVNSKTQQKNPQFHENSLAIKNILRRIGLMFLQILVLDRLLKLFLMESV